MLSIYLIKNHYFNNIHIPMSTYINFNICLITFTIHIIIWSLRILIENIYIRIKHRSNVFTTNRCTFGTYV